MQRLASIHAECVQAKVREAGADGGEAGCAGGSQPRAAGPVGGRVGQPTAGMEDDDKQLAEYLSVFSEASADEPGDERERERERRKSVIHGFLKHKRARLQSSG